MTPESVWKKRCPPECFSTNTGYRWGRGKKKSERAKTWKKTLTKGNSSKQECSKKFGSREKPYLIAAGRGRERRAERRAGEKKITILRKRPFTARGCLALDEL